MKMNHGQMKKDGGQSKDADDMLRAQTESMLWTYFANIGLGIWLIFSPSSLGYESDGLIWSDVASGTAIVALGTLALWRRWDFWGRWGVCFVGLWLLFAPLAFSAPTAAAYWNDTIAGALVIAFSVLVPMMPGRAHHLAMMEEQPDIPPGWSYNPSTWWQRGPIIGLAVISFFISHYMAAYQLGHIGSAWDPFFGDGTEDILTSDVSRAWPISDAGLGALAYLLEALMGFMGNVRRWRTMPWMVLMFGILVVPLGTTSIILIILQPLAVGTWCTLCLVTAGFMLLMIPLALDEVFATIQFLARARSEGQPLWKVFWVGGTVRGGKADRRSPAYDSPSPGMVPAMLWGVTVPWTLAASAALGLWVVASPAIFDSSGTAADSDNLVGALIATTAAIAWAEVARPVRYLNVAFGIWLIAAPWLVGGASTGSVANDVIAGAALIALSLPLGRIREHYGGWDRYVGPGLRLRGAWGGRP